MLTNALGETVCYTNPGVLRFWRQQKQLGTPPAKIFVMILLYSLTRFNLAGKEQSDLSDVLGDSGTTLPDFIARNRAVWIPDESL